MALTESTLKVRVEGCDDTTTVEFVGTEEEVATVIRLAEQINSVSSYGCEPSVSVYRDGKLIVEWKRKDDD